MIDADQLCSPTFFGILGQLLTAGVSLPWYFIAHIQAIPASSYVLPRDSLVRAKTLLPAVVLGYLLPSAVLFLAPASMTLDSRQIIAAIWQPFPIFISILHTTFRNVYASLTPAKGLSPDAQAREEHAALLSLKQSYILSGLLSAVAHWAVIIPAFFSADTPTSFTHIFVPYILHPYLPYHVASQSLAAYRLAARLLFQHDWLFMSISVFIFFAWHHTAYARATGVRSNIRGWFVRALAVTIIGGPGAAFAVEAIDRENRLAQGGENNGSAAHSPMHFKDQ